MKTKTGKRLLALFAALLLMASFIITDAVRKENTADALQNDVEISEESDVPVETEETEVEQAEASEESVAVQEDSEAAEESEATLEELPEEEPVIQEESEVAEESEGEPAAYALAPADDRSPGMPEVHLDGFADEAVYTYGDASFRGLLSECWELAEQNGTGTITLIADVTAHVYDPAYYDGDQYTEDGVTHNAESHAITRFTGGLSTMSVTDGMDIVLDLDGHVLDRNMRDADGTADRAYTIEVFSGGSFTLKDSKGTGKATGGFGGDDDTCGEEYGSFIIVHSGGMLTIDGAEVSGCTGGGAIIGNGKVSLMGGARITDNTNKNSDSCNLVVSNDMEVSAESLSENAEIGIMAVSGRENNAVSYPGGSAVFFSSDMGMDVFMEGNYVALGEVPECEYEAEWHAADGTVSTGTFDEMWDKAVADKSGTLKIMRNLDLSGNKYMFDMTGVTGSDYTMILDFNSHIIKANYSSSSGNFITIKNNVTKGIFKFTDTTGRVKETRVRVDEAGEPSWDAARRIYTYYESYVVDGGLDYGNMIVTEKVTADFSNLGGFDITGYGRVILSQSGKVEIAGGAHRADRYFFQSTYENSDTIVSGGYIFNCGINGSYMGSAIHMYSCREFTMTGGTIVGCKGGAIYLKNDINTITGGAFVQNNANSGGAIYALNYASVSNVLFSNNKASGGAGSIQVYDNIDVNSCSFVGNTGSSGAAIYFSGNSNAGTIKNTQFVGNSASNKGGAIYVDGSTSSVYLIDGCVFEQNKADTGGAITFSYGTLTLSNTTITGNSASTGGGIYRGYSTYANLYIGDNVIVKDNDSTNIYLYGSKIAYSESDHLSGELYFSVSDIPSLNDKNIIKYPEGISMDSLGEHVFTDNESYFVYYTDDNMVYINIIDYERDDLDAVYVDGNGKISLGSFDEIWTMVAEDSSGKNGTLSLLRGVDLSDKNYMLSSGQILTVDFCGYVIRATGTGNFLTLTDNASLTLTDSKGSYIDNRATVTKMGETVWDEQSRIYTYYEADGSLYKRTVDFSKLGGLDLKGYDRAIDMTSSSVVIKSGAYRNVNGFLQCSGSETKSTIRMSGGYVFDSGNENTARGGAFYMNLGSSFSFTDSAAIVGCNANQGGALWIGCVNSVLFNYGRISQCTAISDGGAIYQSKSSQGFNVTNTRFTCNNAGGRGGAIAIESAPAPNKFNTATFEYNSAADGGAMYVLTNQKTFSITMTSGTLSNNKATGNGGAISFDDSAIVHAYFSKVTATGNTANENGGVLYTANDNVTADFTETKWYNNNAALGGSLYVGSNNITFNDGVRMEAKTGGGIYFPKDKSIALIIKPQTLKASVKTEDTDEETSAVIFQNPYKHDIMNILGTITSDDGLDVWSDGQNIYVGGSLASNGVIIQHYANLERIRHSSTPVANQNDILKIINTIGGVMPTNKVANPPLVNMYLNSDGTVITDHVQTQIYVNSYKKAGTLNLNELNIFDPDHYRTTEVWLSKPDTNIGSIDPADWEVIPYTEDMELDLEDGSIVRFVAEQVSGEWSTSVNFYDYDVTDGGFYEFPDDALNGFNKIETSMQSTWDANNRTYFICSKCNGINSPENYSGSGPKLAFGNVNMGVDWEYNVWQSPSGKVIPNGYNRADRPEAGILGTFQGCTFELASNLDEKGNIVYSPGISVPKLFGEGTAIGKTAYGDMDFVFNRTGDTYILTAVTGTNATELEKFYHPGVYNGTNGKASIWTNNFWPMDDAPSWGTDGHDIKMGLESRKGKRLLAVKANTAYGSTPPSDDALDHNSYFGFNFAIKFAVPEGYRGPMEYYFFGDDDMWVFLDGKLVCDIGGVHSSVGEYVNLWDYLTDDDTMEHELKFFYTERGASGSTCWMQFTMPNITEATTVDPTFMYRFTKTDPQGNPIEGAEFTLYSDEECTTSLQVQQSEKDGTVIFTNLEGAKTYYLMETQTADNTWVKDDAVYVLSKNKDGEWFMHKTDDMTPVNTIVNSTIFGPIMPNSGGIGRYVVYGIAVIAGLLAIVIVIVAVKWKKK